MNGSMGRELATQGPQHVKDWVPLLGVRPNQSSGKRMCPQSLLKVSGLTRFIKMEILGRLSITLNGITFVLRMTNRWSKFNDTCTDI